ncbi:MAG: magnesium transporter [Chloroflexi bacterium]|nr:magnesium transporter [Chloroflexota bacterium]
MTDQYLDKQQSDARQSEQERVDQVVDSIREFSEAGDAANVVDALETLRPADQADVVIELSDEIRATVIGLLSTDATARIVEEMRPEDTARIAEDLEVGVIADVLDHVGPDTAADVLHAMSEEAARETLTEMDRSAGLESLLLYADDVAGGLMTTEYASVIADATPAVALDALRLISEDRGDFSSIFVVDDAKQLVGWVPLRRLALARPHQIVRDLMNEDVVSVVASTDQEDCARILARYDLDVLSVTGDDGTMLGIIDGDDLADVAEEEATEDMFRMAGMQGDRTFSPFVRSVRTRLPWLTVNLITTFAAAAVIGLFESTIQRLAILAIFLPVVAGQGGIGGTQTLTLVVRGIALGEITGRQARRVLVHEALLGGFHGLFLALLVGGVAFAWVGKPYMGVVLGIAMFGNMLVAGLVGAGVPLMLRALKQDPAVSSAVVVTTATDITGFFLFLGLAAMFIDQLT